MMNESSNPLVEILLVEDNPADVALTLETFEDSRLANRMSVTRDGIEALSYLRKEGGYSGSVSPDLILLDLNLPRKDGRQVLREIKTDPDLKRIPVIIMTTSDAAQDILQAYEFHANCYLIKPTGIEDFFTLVQAIEDFWFTRVALPSRAQQSGRIH